MGAKNTQDGYAFIRQTVTEELRDEDARGGPLQRQYPPAVIESIAQSVASSVTEYFDLVPLTGDGPKPELLHHDEQTLFKVRQALILAETADAALIAMQNAGILFRERVK